MRSFEEVAAHSVLALGVANDRLDRRAPAQVAFDRLSDAALLAGNVDLHLVVGRGVVAAIAAIGDDAGEARADPGLDLGGDGLERVTVVRIARQRLDVGDELPVFERLSVVATDTLPPNS